MSGGPGSVHRVVLAVPADFEGFRAAARRLLAAAVPPSSVAWLDGDDEADLFASPDPAPASEGATLRNKTLAASALPCHAPGEAGRSARVPRAFLDLAASAALHADPGRYGLIYRVLWRMQDEPALASLASDPDIVRLTRLAKAVRRDIHKMHAFVRFREVGVGQGKAFVAWYEPDHHVVEAAAPFFAHRFASLRWGILTPRRSAHWTGDALVFGPGAPRSAAPSGDGLEDLWRTYYASIFNPARVNPGAMKAEMPVRFWRNLPEAALIGTLVATAPARAAAMVAAAPTDPVRRRGAESPALHREPDRPGLAGLADAARACRACPLWEHATQGVPGEGPEGAALMLVGEQPGDREDLAGRPFIGPAGQVLDTALAEAGLARTALYLTNAVKHFKFTPRGKKRIHKRPEAMEIHACRPWLDREIAQVDPAVILMLGASAAQAVLGRAAAVARERGRPFELPDGRWGLVTWHPAYVLRCPDPEEARHAQAELTADLALAARLARLARAAAPFANPGAAAIAPA